MTDVVDWRNKVCGICYSSQDFRVLQCGHPLCFSCALYIYEINRQTMPCPWDRTKNRRMPHTLPTPKQLNGEILSTFAEDIADHIFEQPPEQNDASRVLRGVAGIMRSYESNFSIVEVTGTTVGVSSISLCIMTWP